MLIRFERCSRRIYTDRLKLGFVYIYIQYETYTVLKRLHRSSMSRFRQENIGNRWKMEAVFLPVPIGKYKNLAGIYRNTVSMFQCFPAWFGGRNLPPGNLHFHSISLTAVYRMKLKIVFNTIVWTKSFIYIKINLYFS